MKALILEEYKRFRFGDTPEPRPGPDEVLIAVKACGICGSDVHGMDGSTGRRRPPIIMGHEAAGVIAATGSAVRGWAEGDRVTFDSSIYCGVCAYCRRGEINLCDNRRVLGVSCDAYRQDGAFAEFVAVPQHILYRLPDGLEFEQGALVEPFSVALHAIRRARVTLNDTAVVVGAGMIGLALAQGLRRAGCGKLIIVDQVDERLALAKRLGAAHVINSASQNAANTILELTHGLGADLAFEAVGVTPTVDLALGCVRKGGKVALLGNVAPKIEFPLQIAVTRELTLYGSCASQGEYPAVLEMMRRGELEPAALISATAPLAEGAAWFGRLYNREAGLLKVVLKPS